MAMPASLSMQVKVPGLSRSICCRDDLLSSMLPKWRQLLTTDLRMLVFSGDVDGIVSHIGTRYWLAELDLPIARSWRPWRSHSGTSHSVTSLALILCIRPAAAFSNAGWLTSAALLHAPCGHWQSHTSAIFHARTVGACVFGRPYASCCMQLQGAAGRAVCWSPCCML